MGISKRVGWIAGAVAAVAVAGGAAYGVPRIVNEVQASQPYPSEAITSTVPPIELPADASVLIFGDSYTDGQGADTQTDGYAWQLAELRGWDADVDGGRGSGYTNKGENAIGTFRERFTANHADDDYDLIIIQGSPNDKDADPATLDQAIDDTLAAITASQPHADVIIVGPSTFKPDYRRERVSYLLEEAAADHGFAFVKLAGDRSFPESDQAGYTNPTDGHPSTLGHHALAEKISAQLEQVIAAR